MAKEEPINIARVRERIEAVGVKSLRWLSLVAWGNVDGARKLVRGPVRTAGFDTTKRLAQALKCSTDYLLDKSEEVGEPPGVELLPLPKGKTRKGDAGKSDLRSGPAMSRLKPDPGVVRIPDATVRVSAGSGVLNTEERTQRWWFLPRAFVRGLGVDPRQAAFLEVDGHSMEPTLLPGDRVLINRGDREIVRNAIYVVRYEGFTFCKRIAIVKARRVALISDNPEEPVREVPSADVEVIGRVRWSSRVH